MHRRPELIPTTFESFDSRMPSALGDRYLVKLFTGCRWTEGPAYFPAGRYLIFSDIPNDRILRYDELTGHTSVFQSPIGHHNGHSADRQGRLLSCEHGNRRVSRIEADGSTTVLADSYQGKRLNSPNDLVEKTDGSIWFTDPAYGIDSDYEGYAADSEIGACHVYRVVPGEQPVIVADDFDRPNGLAFSLDETKLYISDTGRNHMRVFDVDGDKLTGGEVFAECTNGCFDGFRLDGKGRIWTSAGDGVHVYHADGTLLGKLPVPEVVSNLTFGGPRRHDLFITATTSLYQFRMNVTGAPYPR